MLLGLVRLSRRRLTVCEVTNGSASALVFVQEGWITGQDLAAVCDDDLLARLASLTTDCLNRLDDIHALNHLRTRSTTLGSWCVAFTSLYAVALRRATMR